MPPTHRPSTQTGIGLRDLVASTLAADSVGPGSIRLTEDWPDPVVTSVTLDSRRVTPGSLYAALPGASTHGARFAAEAARSGAVAVLTDEEGARLVVEAGVDLPLIVVDDPRAQLGALAAAVFGYPAERLLLFGITGTNGKTTTSYLLHSALTALGRHPGLIGTIETRIGSERVKSVRTTPESPDLQALFAQMVQAGADSCAMEISSHALALHRVDAMVVDVAGFTNLSQDHLDFHDTFEEYFAAKAALFTPEHASVGVICIDDEWGRRLAREATIPVTTLITRPGSTPGEADWVVTGIGPNRRGHGMGVELTHRTGQSWSLTSPLPGDFNASNCVLAAVMLLRVGYDPDDIATALAQATAVPGRMEVVPPAVDNPHLPLGVVDYAHSPGSIQVACAALRSGGCHPLVIVLGAGGDRDRGKREAMGAAAALGADAVVVTDDNPRSEDPAEIRSRVLAGARQALAAPSGPTETPADGSATQSGTESRTPGPGPALLEEVPGRGEAIVRAVRLAVALGDAADRAGPQSGRPTVLVAGKGHETGQEIAGTVHPFDDRVVLAQALTAIAGGPS
ncbi:MAG: UDP-N-acetylmuramoyl-L-alanyl-D-glutamate--2,6-diaminopimelate ligase [Actinomycetales bacterium]